MAKSTLPHRLIRDIERTLQARINDVKNKIVEHDEQCRAELSEVAETFGIEKDELLELAGVPVPEEKQRRRPKKAVKKKKVVKKQVAAKKKAVKKATTHKTSAVKKPSGGTAEEKVAAFLKKNPTASGAAISKATGYSDKTVYNTKAWQDRPQS